MTTLAKAHIAVDWQDPNRQPKRIDVQYNPTEYSLDKQVTLGEVTIPGLDAPLQQYVRGNAEKLTFDLFFDTTESGTGPGATSVTTLTDQIYQLIKIEPERHAPPVLTFIWNSQFPGSSIGGQPGKKGVAQAVTAAIAGAGASAAASAVSSAGASGAAAGTAIGVSLSDQRRSGFRCVLESIKQRFTMFSSEGVPLRATLTVTLREYRTLGDQLEQLGLSSPDRTHAHVTDQTDSLSGIANHYYQRCADWRSIADQNLIDDPRRLAVGRVLAIPRLT